MSSNVNSTLRHAISILRVMLQSDAHYIAALIKKPHYELTCSIEDVEKLEKGIKYCNLYLNFLISIEEFCILMNKCGLHEKIKHQVSPYMSENLVEKYIGYDEVD